MLEVMRFLRANGFKTYIVTGGGQEFVRVYSQKVYGDPPGAGDRLQLADQVRVEGRHPGPACASHRPFFIDDHDGKPVGINLFIGKRPIAAFGNSGGDAEMLQWTGAGKGARLMMLVFHDDAEREYAYGPAGGLPETPRWGPFRRRSWTRRRRTAGRVISMKTDWKRIFP